MLGTMATQDAQETSVCVQGRAGGRIRHLCTLSGARPALSHAGRVGTCGRHGGGAAGATWVPAAVAGWLSLLLTPTHTLQPHAVQENGTILCYQHAWIMCPALGLALAGGGRTDLTHSLYFPVSHARSGKQPSTSLCLSFLIGGMRTTLVCTAWGCDIGEMGYHVSSSKRLEPCQHVGTAPRAFVNGPPSRVPR